MPESIRTVPRHIAPVQPPCNQKPSHLAGCDVGRHAAKSSPGFRRDDGVSPTAYATAHEVSWRCRPSCISVRFRGSDEVDRRLLVLRPAQTLRLFPKSNVRDLGAAACHRFRRNGEGRLRVELPLYAAPRRRFPRWTLVSVRTRCRACGTLAPYRLPPYGEGGQLMPQRRSGRRANGGTPPRDVQGSAGVEPFNTCSGVVTVWVHVPSTSPLKRDAGHPSALTYRLPSALA